MEATDVAGAALPGRHSLTRSGGANHSPPLLADVSGAGNNWAHGHEHYGPLHRDGLLERVRRAASHCDSLQASLAHS